MGATVRRAAVRHDGMTMARRVESRASTAAAWLQLNLQVWPGRRGLLERVLVLLIVVFFIVEGAHGARLRADGGVVAAPLPPLPRGLPPAMHSFSDPPGDQGSLVL